MEDKNFREIIVLERKLKGLTQQELADMIGVSRTSLNTYERGKAVPNLNTFKKLCNALDLSVSDLVTKWNQAKNIDNK